MKRVVYSFAFDPAEEFRLRMPIGSELLSLEISFADVFMIWALCDPNAPHGPRSFRAVADNGSVEDFSPEWKFLGSARVSRRTWHVWDLGDGS